MGPVLPIQRIVNRFVHGILNVNALGSYNEEVFVAIPIHLCMHN